MKNIKKFVALCAALTLCLGFSMAVTACGEDKPASSNSAASSESVTESTKDSTDDSTQDSTDESTSEGETDKTYTAYEITVLNADGTTATNVNVQLCTLDGTMCFMPVAVDTNGVAIYNPTGFPGVGEYDIHVLDATYQPLTLAEAVITEATFGAYTVTLAE